MSKDKEVSSMDSKIESTTTMDVLQKLDQGEIDVEEAERLLMEQTPPVERDTDWSVSEDPLRTRSWWLILFAIGFGFLVFGWGVATLGGWWWLLAAPLLLTGIVLALLGVASMQSPWAHIRIFDDKENRSQKFTFGLPIPIRIATWGLKNFGHYAPQLDRTDVDDILLALDELESNLAQGPPIYVDITDGDNGEHIEVSMG
jgi:hypothetical protein